MDLPQEYTTRGGNKAIVYRIDGNAPYILVGAYDCGLGWIACGWMGNGRHQDARFSGLDLLMHEANPKRYA